MADKLVIWERKADSGYLQHLEDREIDGQDGLPSTYARDGVDYETRLWFKVTDDSEIVTWLIVEPS